MMTITLGMFSEGKKSLLAMSKRVLKSKSQSCLNDFINKSTWNEKDVNDLRLKMLQKNSEFAFSSKGYFVIDDCLIEEFGKQMEGVGEHFDHADNTYKQARILTVLFYIEGENWYPVDVRPYYKKEWDDDIDFKTKNELALEMIKEHLPENKENYPICLFDSWYSGTKLLKSLDEIDVKFVTRLKSNRNLYHQEKKYKPKELFSTLDTDIAQAELEGWNKVLTVALGEQRENAQDKDDNFFLISNIETTTAKELQNHYDFRWPIEPMFKDMKQLFGWADISFKGSLAVLRMIYISFLAYTIAMKERLKQKCTATVGNICNFFRNLSLKNIIKKAFTFGSQNLSLELLFSSFGL